MTFPSAQCVPFARAPRLASAVDVPSGAGQWPDLSQQCGSVSSMFATGAGHVVEVPGRGGKAGAALLPPPRCQAVA